MLLLSLLVLNPDCARGTEIIEDSQVIVRFDEPLEKAAKALVTIYPIIRKELESKLTWKAEFRPTVILIKENTAFQQAVGNPFVVAVAAPTQNLIVIDYSKMYVKPFTLEVTLKHELCHLLLGHNIRAENLPRWVDEGVCQWASGGMAELIAGDKEPFLKNAVLSGRLIPIRLLGNRFPQERPLLYLAYEESRSMIDYLSAEYGAEGLLRVLKSLEDGDSIEDAIYGAISIRFEEFERKWQAHLRRRVTWLAYLSDNIYGIVLFAAALLTVYGSVRILIKRRARRAVEEDDGDAGEQPHP